MNERLNPQVAPEPAQVTSAEERTSDTAAFSRQPITRAKLSRSAWCIAFLEAARRPLASRRDLDQLAWSMKFLKASRADVERQRETVEHK